MEGCHLYKLPNELMLHILTPIPTPELLPLTLISHRIYTIILRILHNRLVAAAELHSHTLLLECYPPAQKVTEPGFFCTYEGTDGLTTYNTPLEHEENLAARLGEMRNMYSRFRPYRRDLEAGGRRVRRPPGDIPGSRTFPGTAAEKYVGETVKQILGLEGHELFAQLCVVAHLVKIGPRHGLFTAFVEVKDGVLRVWRDWLKEMAADNPNSAPIAPEPVDEIGEGKGAIRELEDCRKDIGGNRVLWVGDEKNVGLRLNVRERKLRRNMPILIEANEDLPVSYEIEYDQFLVRTSHLLLMLERSLVQEDNVSGKAVIFSSFG